MLCTKVEEEMLLVVSTEASLIDIQVRPGLLPTSSLLSLEVALAGLGLNQHRSGIQCLDLASE